MAKWKHRGSMAAAAATAASALAAAAYEFEHRKVSQAEITDSHVRIQRLWDMRAEKENLDSIGQGLLEEWGASAFLGFDSIHDMAAKAGQNIFVAQKRLEDGEVQTAVLQTMRAAVGGDPAKLQAAFPTFAELTSHHAWSDAHHKHGDTAVLLQITTLGRQERGGGLGSLLRNAALHMQPTEVKFALTTTPVDRTSEVELNLDDPATYTGAMRFHVRGGAKPSMLLPGYKALPRAEGETQRHASDVVVMRYERNEEGSWAAARPEMRIRRSGPLQQRLSLALRRVGRIRRRRRQPAPEAPKSDT